MNPVEPTLAAPLPIGGAIRSTASTSRAAAQGTVPLRDPEGVRVIGPQERVTLVGLVHELMGQKDLLYQLAARDVRIRYKQAMMGFAWSVLMPLLIVGAGILVRYAVVAMTGVHLDRAEIGTVALKAFPWAFFAGAIGFGVASITSNISLVTKIYFPRSVLPIAVVVSNLFDLAVGVAALLLVLPFLGAKLSLALLWVPVMVALLVVLTAGLCTVLACANLFYRDVKYITQVLLTFGIFFTPVLFNNVQFGARGAKLIMLNPLAPIFEGLRLSVMQGHNLLVSHSALMRGATVVDWQPWYLLYSGVWAFGLLAVGLMLIQRTQDLFAEFA
jgi:ABC-type polysaccharide/polyol phosphate export permease